MGTNSVTPDAQDKDPGDALVTSVGEALRHNNHSLFHQAREVGANRALFPPRIIEEVSTTAPTEQPAKQYAFTWRGNAVPGALTRP